MTKTKVAVYGTLRKGFGNHRLLERGGAEFIGDGHTVDLFTMRASSIPFVSKNGNTNIRVEVYEVDDVTLEDLDSLEGHPDWYEREEVDVKLTDGRYQKAFMYLMEEGTVIRTPIVETGDYKDHVYKSY